MTDDSDPTTPTDDRQPTDGTPTPAARSTSNGLGRWATLLPALTFVVGLGLGWAIVAVASDDDEEAAGDPSAAGSPSASATVDPSDEDGDIVVTVPQACQESAANLREASSLLRDSVGSVKDFDPDELVDTLNRLEEIDQETRGLLDLCSEVDVTQSPTPGDEPSGTPSVAAS